MNYSALNDVLQFIHDHERFVILIHDKPDGDAVGSSTALALFIASLGYKATVVSPSVIPKRLVFVKSPSVTYAEGSEALAALDYDAVLSVDVASDSLLGELPGVLKLPIGYALDHHRVHTLTSEAHYVDPAASAAGEVVFGLISLYSMISGAESFTKEIASALYTAIASDTGCFRYGNTTAETHDIAGKLMQIGIDAEGINRMLFEIKPLSLVMTEKAAYEKMELYHGGKLAIAAFTQADLAAIGATDEDTDTVSQLMRMIEGVEIGVLMREKPTSDGTDAYKFSVRGNTDADVSALCAVFGGGGHKKAAGCTVVGGFDEVLKRFITEAEKFVGKE